MSKRWGVYGKNPARGGLPASQNAKYIWALRAHFYLGRGAARLLHTPGVFGPDLCMQPCLVSDIFTASCRGRFPIANPENTTRANLIDIAYEPKSS